MKDQDHGAALTRVHYKRYQEIACQPPLMLSVYCRWTGALQQDRQK